MGSLTSSTSNQKERSLSFTNKILAINMEKKLNQNYRTGVLNWSTRDFGSTEIPNVFPLNLHIETLIPVLWCSEVETSGGD